MTRMYNHGGHTKHEIMYHFVLITKYRYKILTGDVAVRCRELLRQTCATKGIEIMRGAIAPEHVHMLLKCPTTLSPAEVMQLLKGRSSRMLQQEFPVLRKRYYGQHMWARGYFCGTVGVVDEATIREYVEKQGREEEEQFKIVL